VLYVLLRFADSDYHFGIFKHFLLLIVYISGMVFAFMGNHYYFFLLVLI